MTIAALFAWPLFWLVHAAIAPTRLGDRPRSNPIYITRARAAVLWDGTVSAFAHVQERGEFRFYKIATALIGLAIDAIALAMGAPPVAILIGGLVALGFVELAVRGIRAIDIAGHGAEIMAAAAVYGAGTKTAQAYRIREAESVADQYDTSQAQALEWIDSARLARVIYWLGRAR